MAETRLERRIASGALWSYAAHATGRLAVFGGLAILARLLSPHEFGLFAMAATVANFFEVVRDFGLRSAVIYFGREDESAAIFDTGFWLALASGAAITAALLVLAPAVAAFYGYAEVTTLMQVLSIYFLIAGLGAVPDAILRQKLEFGRRFWPETGAPVARYTVAIALAVQGFGVWSLVVGQLAGILLSGALSTALCRWSPGFRFRRATARKLIGYAGQMSVVDLLAALILNLDYLLVGRFLGSSALGLYTLAFKLPDTTITAMGYVLSNLLLPTYVRLNEDRAKLRAGFLQALHYLALLLSPAAAGLCVLAPALVPLVLGEQWSGAIPAVQLLAVASLVQGILFSAGTVLVAGGRPGLLIAAQMVWAGTLAPCLFVAAQVNITAVAAVHIVGIVAFAVAKLMITCRFLVLDPRELLLALKPSLLSVGAMVIVLVTFLQVFGQASPAFIAAAGVGLGVVVYGTALWILDPTAVRHARAFTNAALHRS